jgi:probable HAF family extracellular repeat protein
MAPRLLTLTVACSCPAALGQVSFHVLPHPAGMQSAVAVAVSSNGSVIAGSASTSSGAVLRAVRWSSAGIELLTVPPGSDNVLVNGISGAAGSAVGSIAGQPFTWGTGQSVVTLPAPGPGYAVDASPDGTFVVGTVTIPFQGERAARWTQGQLQVMPGLPGFPQSHAWGVSADGTVVGEAVAPGVGHHAFRWPVGGAPEDLGTLPGDSRSVAWGISADASVIVGHSWSSSLGERAFRWTRTSGMIWLFGPGQARKVSSSGAVVVGFIAAPAHTPVLWREGLGPTPIAAYLASAGINPGGAITEVADVSDDGRSLVGSVTVTGVGERAWLARIPAHCNADCTFDQLLNVADFTCFLQRFAANDPYANCDGSTAPPVLNVADFTCYLQRFAAGCP